ncbi:regulator of gluconeogenesis Rmd5 like protein [Teratosphaeria destructans]|uniref:GID complex catalytic subunit 2 n=1 Tax=Teratosphaeria destructans TaxID=418781 RepID=A0A9W7W1F3_9PEZI|nr:regulator of gluconeogenesis Rmd5 like protein [Teratosphaeria destructans]
MDALIAAHTTLEKRANLSKALADVDTLIQTLQNTRDSIQQHPDAAPLRIAELKKPIKQSFDKIEEDLKEVNKGLNQYQKALKEKFKAGALPNLGFGGGGDDAAEGGEDEGGEAVGLGSESKRGLLDRAIAMHLLREGKFGVASTFVAEVDAKRRREQRRKRRKVDHSQDGEEMDGVVVDGGDEAPGDEEDGSGTLPNDQDSWIRDFQTEARPDPDDIMSSSSAADLSTSPADPLARGHLQQKFAEMYRILDALRNHHNLQPAIDWAAQHSAALDQRGSTLEFELSRLKFVELYSSHTPPTPTPTTPSELSGPLSALAYARRTFPTFSTRYATETVALLGSLAFAPDLASSPYHNLFTTHSTYATVSQAFTREFCTLLALPAASPLYTATTAGTIALPVLAKLASILNKSRGQWTSVNELPVETPLPPGFSFHAVFVCPVSKEQATDANPPMMLPCGHVIAKESLEMHARGKSRMKCPYCPGECRPSEARRVYV